MIDSKNQWISAEEKCSVIESYNAIESWSPLVSNQSSSFNQQRIIQNFDRISCIMQEYNETKNELETRVVNIECQFSALGNGNHSYVYISNQRDIRNSDGATFFYDECGFYFKSEYIYSTTRMNMCESTVKNGYKYIMSDHKYDAVYEQEGPYYTTVTSESLFQICIYKID